MKTPNDGMKSTCKTVHAANIHPGEHAGSFPLIQSVRGGETDLEELEVDLQIHLILTEMLCVQHTGSCYES